MTTRVAGEKLREQADRLASASAQPAPSVPKPGAAASPAATVAPPVSPPPTAPNLASAADGTRRMARGAGRFGAALVRPFAHATGIIWNQIVGVFFALFALLFGEHVWILHKSAGLRDRYLILYSILALLFAWFAVSSFWRARRRQR
ncbi:MAG TPA: hypothetical protein VMD25_06465 [Acidobacteriaceae bacterium]|nr:hypothetical protein [Acidobacteriaceae bacterium]